MAVRVVAVDMDGTFLRTDGSYDRDRFLLARQRMRERGVRFVVASGNQVHQLRSFFGSSDEVAYVAENGHLVFDVGDERPLSAAALGPGTVRRVLSALDRYGHPYVTCGHDRAYLRHDAGEWERTYFGRFYHRLRRADDLTALREPVMKFALATRGADPVPVARALAGELGDVVTPVVSGPQDVDLNAPGWHKAAGLGVLLRRWDVAWDEVAAFGDSGNDLELVAAAGAGYAMANARDELVAVAAHRAPGNDRDGVLAVLEDLLA